MKTRFASLVVMAILLPACGAPPSSSPAAAPKASEPAAPPTTASPPTTSSPPVASTPPVATKPPAASTPPGGSASGGSAEPKKKGFGGLGGIKKPPDSTPPVTSAPSAPTSSSPSTSSHPLPDFPWPPPATSAQVVLQNSLFEVLRSAPPLSAVGRQLENALNEAKYFEYSYYRAPGGFALVARLERIAADGTPMPEQFRFLLPGSQEPFSLASYIKQLLFAPEGFYRQIVFTVTDQPFAATGAPLTAASASHLLSGGVNRLSSDFDTTPFSEAHRVTALIYEFRKGSKDGDVSTLTPSRLGARTHLERARIYQALQHP